MKITNKYNWPDALVRAVENDPYTRGDSDISVTQLIDAPQIRKLFEKHGHEVEIDISDMIWALWGQAIHVILERANKGNIAEKRYYARYDGKVLSGAADLITIPGTLLDWKTCKAYAVIYGKKSWEAQLNVLKRLAETPRKYGQLTDGPLFPPPIKSLKVFALIKDWNQYGHKKDWAYPKTPGVFIEYPIWPAPSTDAYIHNRLSKHFGPYIECTDEECWKRPDKWALKKRGRKRATKLYNAREDIPIASASDPDFEIEFRPGEYVRCESYCPVREFCPQRKERNVSNNV